MDLWAGEKAPNLERGKKKDSTDPKQDQRVGFQNKSTYQAFAGLLIQIFCKRENWQRASEAASVKKGAKMPPKQLK